MKKNIDIDLLELMQDSDIEDAVIDAFKDEATKCLRCGATATIKNTKNGFGGLSTMEQEFLSHSVLVPESTKFSMNF